MNRDEILKTFPDFLDFLSLGLSVGLNFNQALQETFKSLPHSPLKIEIENIIFQLNRGQSQEVVLNSFAKKMKDPHVSAVISLIHQGLKLGFPLKDILVTQAEVLRENRFRAIEKQAQTLSIRLLFPILLFIFPALFILLLGGLYLQVIQSGGAF